MCSTPHSGQPMAPKSAFASSLTCSSTSASESTSKVFRHSSFRETIGGAVVGFVAQDARRKIAKSAARQQKENFWNSSNSWLRPRL